MKAAIFYGPNQKLRIEEVSEPVPSDNEVVVKVVACGLCHTDLHYIDHGVPTFKKPPLILGHEPAGIVYKVGRGVRNLKEGDRVLIPAVFSCGSCRACRTGRENICDTMVMLGNNIDGGYAENVVVPAKDLAIVPEDIPLSEIAVVADAVSTPFHAVVNRAKVKAGDVISVFGCGGVGINIVQIASIVGAKVIAVDIVDSKLEKAKKLGASITLNANNYDNVAKEIRKLTDGGVDIAFEAIGNPKTLQNAFDTLRRGGTLCVVGYCSQKLEWSFTKVMYYEMQIIGSLGCRPVDYPKIINLVKENKLNIKELISAKFPLDKINEAFDFLRSGEGLRTIIMMSG